jgi:hypothetical protein
MDGAAMDGGPAGRGSRVAALDEPRRGRAAGRAAGRSGRGSGRGGFLGRLTGGSKRQVRFRLLIAGSGLVAVALVTLVVVVTLLSSSGPAHMLRTPGKVGDYLRRPQLEQQMDARQLQQQVMNGSAGQASRVVSAVYENATGVSGQTTPQIFLFIGGKLSGTSPGDFISSFRGQFKGAIMASPGTMGGEAVCVNAQSSMPGTVALCAWADNDTFGVFASPTMHAAQLGAQMRAVRPGLEHVVK